MEKSPSDGFDLIWFYWAKKYMSDKIRPRDSIPLMLAHLKKHYSLESVDSRHLLEGKIAAIKQQRGLHTPIYIVDPQRQLNAMQAALLKENEQFKNELYSYYINIKNVFVVYCNEWEGSERLSSRGGSGEDNRDNISEGNPGYKASKMHDNRTEGNKSRPEQSNSSIVNKIFHSLEDECLESRNDSIYEGIQEKIDELEILDKMTEFEGVQIWNCKYKHIPHSYVKIKKDIWQTCFSLPLIHPAQPRFISNRLPILPRITPLLPSPDHLSPLLAYLQLLDKFFPAFSPTINSIFQIKNYPIIFSREEGAGWNEESGVAMLCYSVVKGKDPKMSTTRVQKWAEANSDTALAKHIKEMSKRQRERRRQNKDVESKALVLFNGQHEEEQIW